MESDTITEGPLAQAKLYGILDTGYVEVENMMHVASQLLEGGAGVLQLRAKGYDAEGVLALARKHLADLPALCRKHQVPFIINDFPDVAVALGADGVHIGQDDGSLAAVRQVVGSEMLVGRSTHSVEQAQGALAEGFDYIGFGPLFPTPTKQGRPGIGLENIRVVQETVGCEIPVFCIGGVKPDNLELVLASGARRVVIVSALLLAEDVQSSTREVVSSLGESS
ncbi:thiamine phosphate synthase [Verrucomicrobiaceae bacterium 5K15]|uniref:Thiamine-phosphate synthase n=2 Tax=Oceaniferula flava TaxID=2800421 RepID=A0AAE2SA63_9BACT|nr:thiamine phosphate synthase [Oceaniferula flavus]MBM1135606.1 thiamine phosphate synthase [Oceaniferula flavus]